MDGIAVRIPSASSTLPCLKRACAFSSGSCCAGAAATGGSTAPAAGRVPLRPEEEPGGRRDADQDERRDADQNPPVDPAAARRRLGLAPGGADPGPCEAGVLARPLVERREIVGERGPNGRLELVAHVRRVGEGRCGRRGRARGGHREDGVDLVQVVPRRRVRLRERQDLEEGIPCRREVSRLVALHALGEEDVELARGLALLLPGGVDSPGRLVVREVDQEDAAPEVDGLLQVAPGRGVVPLPEELGDSGVRGGGRSGSGPSVGEWEDGRRRRERVGGK